MAATTVVRRALRSTTSKQLKNTRNIKNRIQRTEHTKTFYAYTEKKNALDLLKNWHFLIVSLLRISRRFSERALETFAGVPDSPDVDCPRRLLCLICCYGDAALSRMRTPQIPLSLTLSVTLVGLALNNILPAKAGEVAKAAWLGRDEDTSLDKALGLVFMERFLTSTCWRGSASGFSGGWDK